MPLHTDAEDRDGNLTDEEYHRLWLERIERAGDAGLHCVPEKYLKEGHDEDR